MPQAKRKQINTAEPLFSPRFKELSSEIVVFICVAVSLYALLALITYSPTDPGWSHSGGEGQSITNLGGKFGATASDALLHGFGYNSFLVPILILALGLRYYRGRHQTHEPSFVNRMLVTVGFIITVMGGCGLESLHFDHFANSKPFVGGGFLGDWLNRSVVDLFGYIGSTLIMVTMFITGITIFTGLSWFWLMDTIGAKFFELIETIQEKREQKEDRSSSRNCR